MVKEFENKHFWAVILGGSSGLGLATAQKLAKHGCNICIVHRNRKSELPAIEKEFAWLKKEGVELLTFNVDGLKEEERNKVILALRLHFGDTGKIRVFVHSVAKGNLKPMVSEEKTTLKNDDFRLTIDAMALSLYDWTTALFEAKLFASDARIISFTSEGNSKAWKNYGFLSGKNLTYILTKICHSECF